MRIFIEGQEEWGEPSGEAMVAIAKYLLGPCGLIALIWGIGLLIVHGVQKWPLGQTIAAGFFLLLSGAFWLGGKLLIYTGRKMREKGAKLPLATSVRAGR